MAPSFRPKSNSSASKSPKPTFRRAPSKGVRPSAPAQQAPGSDAGSSQAKRAASYRVGVRHGGDAPTRAGASGPGRAGEASVPRKAAAAGRPAARGAAARGSVKALPQVSGKAAVPAAPARGAVAAPARATSPAAPQEPTKRKAVPTGSPQTPPAPAPSRRRPAGSARPRKTLNVPASRTAAPQQGGPAAPAGSGRLARAAGAVTSALSAPFRRLGARAAGAAAPDRPRRRWGRIALIVLALVAILAGGAFAIANSSLFAATDIQIKGGVRVTEEELRSVVSVPEGTTLLNADTASIAESARKIPWVSGVKIERRFPHTLVITPEERTVAAIAYIASDDVAWAISADGTWVAPLTVSATVDAEGNPVEDPASVPEGTELTELTGADAALVLAREASAVLITDVAAGVAPSSGKQVDSEVITAGLAYATGFSADFLKQVKDISVPSVEAISIHLASGVEVSLGAPENIETKERVVTKLLAQEENVTYINVRTPDAYTFRSAQTD